MGALKGEEPPNSPLFWIACGSALTAARIYKARRLEAVLDRAILCARSGGHFSEEWLEALRRDVQHEGELRTGVEPSIFAHGVLLTELRILLDHIHGNLSARRLARGGPP